MARLASKAKAGFYPTPLSVLENIKSVLEITPGARLLDPCCGEGKSLSYLAKDTQAINYGVELDKNRHNASKERLDNVLWGDALTETKISLKSFGLLFLNPPYDYDVVETDTEKAQRLEVRFLNKYYRTLQNDGWLIYIIPYNILKHSASLLAKNFTEMHLFAFPEGDFQSFKQCVLIGKRATQRKAIADKMTEEFTRVGSMTAAEFLSVAPDTSHMIKLGSLQVPEPGKVKFRFESRRIDPDSWVSRINKDGLFTNLLEQLYPRHEKKIRPLAPLLQGHMGLVLAGGLMNGSVKKNGKHLVIKGTVLKEHKIMSQTHNPATEITTTKVRDVYNITVKAIDMNTAQIMTIQ